ncbi:MAG TPA: N-6 DNA methylase [Gemmatimonadales bacterium]
MGLDGVLRGIRSLRDLPGLLAAMGQVPLYEPVPTLAGRFPSDTQAVAVGRSGAFPWFAIDTAAPERAARTLAKRLAQRGRIVGVVGLNAPGRRLALAVGTEGTPALTIDLDRPSPGAIASLSRMGGVPEGGALAFAARVADALSIEDVGRRFFREFRAVLERMTSALAGIATTDDGRDFVLLQLTRVLFLYFVQAKGWLAGRERFLGEEVDRCLAARKPVHRDLLRPLFFGTLNRPIAERGRRAGRFGAIPFLNGGLFEPHPLERRVPRDLPNDLWRDAFDRLFERFHFTIAEGSAEGRIAPDMLGRVFEGVMAPDARRASGTYYTPATLVTRMVDIAILTAVAARLECGDSEAEWRLESGNPRAIRAAAALTILDPAVGSGAFLLGALERLAALPSLGQEDEGARKRRVLQRNLFGVDRSGTAVRLAELRLWLAVIAGERAERPTSVRPLPNLDCLVRQGDSLFEPPGCGGMIHPSSEVAHHVNDLRRRVVAAVGQSKGPLVRELRTLETRAAAESFEAADSRLRTEITECIRAARARDLFGGRRGLDATLRDLLLARRTELRAVRAARRILARDRELPWFHYQSHFPDVFAAGGFDIVIGNPPWLRAEEIPRPERQRLADRYRWWRGSGGYRNRPDLSVAFLERAVELTTAGGVVAMLVPAKLATASYGAAARHALAATSTLLAVSDLTGQAEAAFDATVYPLAIVLRRSRPAAGHRVRTSLAAGQKQGVTQSRLRGGGPWVLTGGRARSVLTGLAREHPALGDSVACHLGLKTGANALFLDPPDGIEAELLRRAVRGRDVSRFGVAARRRLLFTHGADGRPLAWLPPAAAAHVASHLEALRQRADFRDGPPWTLFRVRAATAAHRVVWADVARSLAAAALTCRGDHDLVPLNTCYVAVTETRVEAERLAGWLNSTWIGLAARLGAVPAAGGFARFAGHTIGRLPLPPSVLRDARLGQLAVAARGGASVQHELDDIAAHHLGLSASDQAALRAMVSGRAVHHR